MEIYRCQYCSERISAPSEQLLDRHIKLVHSQDSSFIIHLCSRQLPYLSTLAIAFCLLLKRCKTAAMCNESSSSLCCSLSVRLSSKFFKVWFHPLHQPSFFSWLVDEEYQRKQYQHLGFLNHLTLKNQDELLHYLSYMNTIEQFYN